MRYSTVTGVASPYDKSNPVRNRMRYITVPGSLFHRVHEQRKAGMGQDPLIVDYGMAIFVDLLRAGIYGFVAWSAMDIIRNGF